MHSIAAVSSAPAVPARAILPGLVSLVLGAAACAIEAILLFGYSTHAIAPAAALAAHGGVTTCCALFAFLFRRNMLFRSYLTHLAIWTAISGPFGAAAVMMAVGFSLFSKGAQEDFSSWYERFSPENEVSPLAMTYADIVNDRLPVGGAEEVRSLRDWMAHGDSSRKLTVLSILAKKYQPQHAGTLKAALRDDDPSVRVLAATVMAKLNAIFSEEIEGLRARTRDEPENAKAWFDLALAQDAYAHSNLLGNERRDDYRVRAASSYETCLQLMPSHMDARLYLGRLCVRQGEFGKAVDILDPALFGDAMPLRAWSWRAEALFALGDRQGLIDVSWQARAAYERASDQKSAEVLYLAPFMGYAA